MLYSGKSFRKFRREISVGRCEAQVKIEDPVF